MIKRMAIVGFVCCGLAGLFSTTVVAQQMQLEVIELYHRSAEELIPVLQPMLVPGGRISGLGDKLVVRSTPGNLAEIRGMLASLDARPQMLSISVWKVAGASRDALDADVTLDAETDSAGVTISGKEGNQTPGAAISERRSNASARARINASRVQNTRDTVQTVQVIEGTAGYFTVGSAIPLRNRVRSVDADGATVSESTSYHEIGNGFYALARTSGGRVTIQLAHTSDVLVDRRTGVISLERISSVVTGALGQWLLVGAIDQRADGKDRAVIRYRSESADDERSVYIKVDRVE